jgi:hypothetical protein
VACNDKLKFVGQRRINRKCAPIPIDSDRCAVSENRALLAIVLIEKFMLHHFEQPNPLMQSGHLLNQQPGLFIGRTARQFGCAAV